MTSELGAISNNDTLRSFELIMNNSASDSVFLIRVFSSPSVESTFDTMCSKSFTGGVINVVAMDDAQTLARQLMYGLGINLGFINLTSASCKCQAQTVCMMADTSSQNPISISVSNCNINKFNQREKSCLMDSQLPYPATCGNGLVEVNEQCDCLPDDSECKMCCENCSFRTGAECSSGACCLNCQFRISEQCQNCKPPSGCAENQRGCNSWDCVCKNVIGKEAIAASTECLDELQADASSAFCGITPNCSILLTECDIVLCVADEVALPVAQSLKIANVSISGSPTCSNLYAVGSAVTDGLPPTDGMVCQVNGICVSGKCDTQGRLLCNDNEGTICSNNGKCDKKTNKCLCECEWTGRLCNTLIPESKRKCPVSGNTENNATGIQTTHIIAAFIGIVFAAAVVSGATSVGYKRLQKRNRLQTKHERNMLR
ncbi:disintegrin and metalloproteinase domain-containing protein 22-like [Anneissia japonica]|uniref:disintegrin and metalloproteinase domain-containing protein 22-like n=1 Tax=Anneissia japonica TaxID=1529436 RepID=UPI00142550F8|nr:disintegrin and metalloproteinase domain-containing protein 22-like [Anneissia japonica]